MDPFTDMIQAFGNGVVSWQELANWAREWASVGHSARDLVCRASEYGTLQCVNAWHLLSVVGSR